MKYRESILSMNKNEQTLGNKNYLPKIHSKNQQIK